MTQNIDDAIIELCVWAYKEGYHHANEIIRGAMEGAEAGLGELDGLKEKMRQAVHKDKLNT